MTDIEIIDLLGGVTAVARMLDIKPPSVSGWLESGIPDGRLRDLAGQIEMKSEGRFTRKNRWPEKYGFYWPELAETPQRQDVKAIEPVAPEWDGIERRLITRQTTAGAHARRDVDKPGGFPPITGDLAGQGG